MTAPERRWRGVAFQRVGGRRPGRGRDAVAGPAVPVGGQLRKGICPVCRNVPCHGRPLRGQGSLGRKGSLQSRTPWPRAKHVGGGTAGDPFQDGPSPPAQGSGQGSPPAQRLRPLLGGTSPQPLRTDAPKGNRGAGWGQRWWVEDPRPPHIISRTSVLELNSFWKAVQKPKHFSPH